MKKLIPEYMPSFSCLMGACRHTCCAGWEIDIDEESFHRYQHIPGQLGMKLKENIIRIDGQPQFQLDEAERCPFLKADGLCELILALGEDSLCRICTDHPRFRNVFSDRIEEGVGMCCEAAAKLILGWQAPVRLLETQSSGQANILSMDEQKLLNERNILIKLLQDRRIPVERRIAAMLLRYGMKLNRDVQLWQAIFLRLERLDAAWTKRLENLSRQGKLDSAEKFETAFEQLAVYLLYRHLPAALDDDLFRERIYFAALIWWILRKMLTVSEDQSLEELAEICRLYSSEIEYSDENIDPILNEIKQRI